MRDEDTLINNLFTDCLDEVLEDKNTDDLFQRLHTEPIGLFSVLNEENPPTSEDITTYLLEPQKLLDPKEQTYDYPPFEKEIKSITELEDDQLLKR